MTSVLPLAPHVDVSARHLEPCWVCPRACRVGPGVLGLCGARIGGENGVIARTDLRLATRAVGPVEDHALFHFLPGARSLGLGFPGCSAQCVYCQNWELALAPRLGLAPSIEEQADHDPIAAARAGGCSLVTFTYNEPSIWPERIARVAREAHEVGLAVALVTNGYVTDRWIDEMLPSIDALKIDLKGPNDAITRTVAGIEIGPVLRLLDRAMARGIWVEISTVVVPDLLDTPAAIRALAGLILDGAGAETPWHLQRFFPAYRQIETAPGDIATVLRARAVAIEAGLNYVYLSNVPGVAERSTWCPGCGALLAERCLGSRPSLPAACPSCGRAIPGRGLAAHQSMCRHSDEGGVSCHQRSR